MTFVNMKKLDRLVEARVLTLIGANEANGMLLSNVKSYFYVGRVRNPAQHQDLPGWVTLSANKRQCRVARVISGLIKGGRARIEIDKTGFYDKERLVLLNVLDKIVVALQREDNDGAK